MKKRRFIEKISILALFLLLIIFIMIVPNLNTDINIGKLIINEIMLVNNNTMMDKYGKYSDYIELYNGNDYDINLYGYYLSDSMKDTKKWTFPDITIKANDYLIIFASGKNEIIDGEIHTNFKLDAKGETIVLSNSSGKVISKVYVKETLKDTSYGYLNDKYVYFYSGTPGSENKGSFSNDPIYEVKNDYKLEITEYMTNNLNYYKAFDNKFYSLIELHNYSKESINLEGFYLSDKKDNLTKYKLPNIELEKDGYLIIFASGLDKYEKDEIHTNFKLNNDDGTLSLIAPNKSIIEEITLQKLEGNISYGYYEDKWYKYSKPSFGGENKDNYIKDKIENKVFINEVSIFPKEAIELKNESNESVSLNKYSISDKSGNKYYFKNQNIKAGGYVVYNTSTLGFSINNTNEVIYLYYDDEIVDTFNVNKITGNISTGRSNGKKVYYKNITLGSQNSDKEYLGFSSSPIFSTNGGYIEKGSEITLTTPNNSEIYYTTNGSFPNKNSIKYTKPIKIEKNMVIKAISYKDNYLESDIVSRTFIVDRKFDVAFISISSDNNNFFGNTGIITNYNSKSEKKMSFEFYESNGLLGTSFIGDVKLSGVDSRKEPQKSMSVYLRKRYGESKVTYPFFSDMEYHTYSSLLLRNAGEDPKNVRIMDAALTRALKGQMDIDMQEYRPVVVYINGVYYGLYNLREKLNGDYVESKFGINKEKIDLIKYTTPTKGNNKDYNNLINYIKTHNTASSDVYEYLKKKIDMQELINYWIVESYYGNTDLGNIRYWKDDTGKWRWMVYDLDWSLWNTSLDIAYPTKFSKVPAATYLGSSLTIIRNLYKNSEFRDLYLKSLAKYLKEVFKPERMNKIIDELKSEIESEMPYHIKRWGSSYPSLSNMNMWNNNIQKFKSSLTNRYNKVLSSLKSNFNLSNNEYNKYFGDLK